MLESSFLQQARIVLFGHRPHLAHELLDNRSHPISGYTRQFPVLLLGSGEVVAKGNIGVDAGATRHKHGCMHASSAML